MEVYVVCEIGKEPEGVFSNIRLAEGHVKERKEADPQANMTITMLDLVKPTDRPFSPQFE